MAEVRRAAYVRAFVPLLCVGLVAPLAGCVTVVAAGVPTPLLESQGWRENATARDSQSAWAGLVRNEMRTWEDRGRDEGYPGRLVVVTAKAPVSPAEEDLVPKLRSAIQAWARRQGVELGPVEAQGERQVLSGATSRWFVHNATATASGFLYTRNAELKVLGEVWECKPARSAVMVVGFAQVTDARTVGGLVTNPGRDPATWHEIVADPQGTIGGARGSSGLAWNVVCT